MLLKFELELSKSLDYEMMKGSLHSVEANKLDGDVVVIQFELQSCYYYHFRTNNFRKGMNSLITSSVAD